MQFVDYCDVFRFNLDRFYDNKNNIPIKRYGQYGRKKNKSKKIVSRKSKK